MHDCSNVNCFNFKFLEKFQIHETFHHVTKHVWNIFNEHQNIHMINETEFVRGLEDILFFLNFKKNNTCFILIWHQNICTGRWIYFTKFWFIAAKIVKNNYII